MELDVLGKVADLPRNDDVMATRFMGEGLTVIALWSPVDTHYQHVRGQHGEGGLEAIDFASLFHGVPDAVTTQFVVVASSTGSPALLVENVQQRIGVDFRAANVRVMKDSTHVRVNRSGVVS
jgi:hypothetical protein